MVIKCQTKRFQTDLVAVFIITKISNTGISILNYFPNPLAKLSMNPKMDNLFWFKIDMQDFRTCMNVIVNQLQNLTKTHQDEIGSWSSNQYDNSTLIFVTGAFIPRFEKLLNSVQNMTYPPDYEYKYNALVNH